MSTYGMREMQLIEALGMELSLETEAYPEFAVNIEMAGKLLDRLKSQIEMIETQIETISPHSAVYDEAAES